MFSCFVFAVSVNKSGARFNGFIKFKSISGIIGIYGLVVAMVLKGKVKSARMGYTLNDGQLIFIELLSIMYMTNIYL